MKGMTIAAAVTMVLAALIGLSRARNRSNPRLLIAIGATALMPISIIGTGVALVAPLDQNLLLFLLALGFSGFVLGVVTGFIAPERTLKPAQDRQGQH